MSSWTRDRLIKMAMRPPVDQRLEQRDPHAPHPWLDCTLETKAGETVDARFIVQRPFRCTGVRWEGPIECAAGWELLQFYVGPRTQLAFEDETEIPLQSLLRVKIVTERADVGTEIRLRLRNTGRRRGLSLRLLGELG